jgi:hypothetical protein
LSGAKSVVGCVGSRRRSRSGAAASTSDANMLTDTSERRSVRTLRGAGGVGGAVFITRLVLVLRVVVVRVEVVAVDAVMDVVVEEPAVVVVVAVVIAVVVGPAVGPGDDESDSRRGAAEEDRAAVATDVVVVVVVVESTGGAFDVPESGRSARAGAEVVDRVAMPTRSVNVVDVEGGIVVVESSGAVVSKSGRGGRAGDEVVGRAPAVDVVDVEDGIVVESSGAGVVVPKSCRSSDEVDVIVAGTEVRDRVPAVDDEEVDGIIAVVVAVDSTVSELELESCSAGGAGVVDAGWSGRVVCAELDGIDSCAGAAVDPDDESRSTGAGVVDGAEEKFVGSRSIGSGGSGVEGSEEDTLEAITSPLARRATNSAAQAAAQPRLLPAAIGERNGFCVCGCGKREIPRTGRKKGFACCERQCIAMNKKIRLRIARFMQPGRLKARFKHVTVERWRTPSSSRRCWA